MSNSYLCIVYADLTKDICELFANGLVEAVLPRRTKYVMCMNTCIIDYHMNTAENSRDILSKSGLCSILRKTQTTCS